MNPAQGQASVLIQFKVRQVCESSSRSGRCANPVQGQAGLLIQFKVRQVCESSACGLIPLLPAAKGSKMEED